MAKTATARRGEDIRRFIVNSVQNHPRDISRVTGKQFGISRQAVNKHLRRLVDEGVLQRTGRTRNQSYALAKRSWKDVYALNGLVDEDEVWRNGVAREIGSLPQNLRDIWHYGFTEMFNNALDHSQGQMAYVSVTRTAMTTEITILDDGIGIFKKIQNTLGLLDERHAILELTKGKLTTDPDHHTGEGIFFTSRLFDTFDILSGGVFYSHEIGHEADWLVENPQDSKGTMVFMRLGNNSPLTLNGVFAEYTNGDGLSFTRTIVPVRLARYGNDNLISRSQAKRVLARVEAFSEVVLDFTDVPIIGQGFADEAFRVFRRQHPNVSITPINANENVQSMINWVRP